MSDLLLAIEAAGPPVRLRLVRTLRGVTQREVERRAGLPRSTLSHLETGRRAAAPAVQLRLALALDTDVDALFGGPS